MLTINRSVLSGDLEVPIVSADLVDGEREFQTVGATIENDLSSNELMTGGRCSLLMADVVPSLWPCIFSK